MHSNQSTTRQLILSYLSLRMAIGIIGVSLPLLMAGGESIFGTDSLLSSISQYYYSTMGDVFVGCLCAMGVFLFSYKGYDHRDNLVANLASACAIGVAIFPTTQTGVERNSIGMTHLVCAVGLFLTLAYFCLVLFRKSDPRKKMTPRKKVRNTIYSVCGWSILACIILIGLASQWPKESLQSIEPVFWLETIAVVCFGVSWLIKGEAILKDQLIEQSSEIPGQEQPT